MRHDLPIEAYLVPREPTSSVTPAEKIRAVSQAMRRAKADKALRRVENVFASADAYAAQDLDLLDIAEIEREREIRDGVRSWMRASGDWIDRIEDEMRERLITLCAMHLRSECSKADWMKAVTAARASIRLEPEPRLNIHAYGARVSGGW
jgi:hypothetical protein